MIDRVRIDFRDPRSRSASVTSTARAVLLVMKGPQDRSQRENLVEWYVQAQVLYRIPGAGGEPEQLITLPASPSIPRERYFVNDALSLGVLPSYARAVAIGLFPDSVISWRFDFSIHDMTTPDAMADVWLVPVDAPHVQCGFFLLPHGDVCRP